MPSIFEMLGLGTFFFYLIRGLKTKINSLGRHSKSSEPDLSSDEKRYRETEKVGAIYEELANLPTDIDNYKTFISKTRD